MDANQQEAPQQHPANEPEFLELCSPHGELTQATEMLIAKLIEDKVDQWVSNGPDDLVEIAQSGFQGFRTLPLRDLVQRAYDAGLDQGDETVKMLLGEIELGLQSHTAPHKDTSSPGM